MAAAWMDDLVVRNEGDVAFESVSERKQLCSPPQVTNLVRKLPGKQLA